MVRVARKPLLDVVQLSVYFTVGEGSFAQQDALSEVGVVDFGGDLHDSSVFACMSAESELLELELYAGVVETQSAGIKAGVGLRVEVVYVEVDLELDWSVQLIHLYYKLIG